MKRTIFISFLFFVGTIKAQVITDSVKIDENWRWFHYTKPDSNIKFTSLIFVIHGSNGNGLEMRKRTLETSKIEEKASQEQTLIVYPSAYKRYWNECRKASPAEANMLNINEQDFFEAMIKYFQQHYGIHKNQVFVAGTSGGGHMAYKLALTMPGKFRAIAAFIANLPNSNNMDCVTTNVKAIPMMIVNGTNDPINPYNGGDVNLGSMKMGAVQSTAQTLSYWANLAQYKGNPMKEDLPDKVLNDGQTIEKYTYKKKHHPEIVLYKVIGMGHSLPSDIDGLVEALTFFKRQIK